MNNSIKKSLLIFIVFHSSYFTFGLSCAPVEPVSFFDRLVHFYKADAVIFAKAQIIKDEILPDCIDKHGKQCKPSIEKGLAGGNHGFQEIYMEGKKYNKGPSSLNLRTDYDSREWPSGYRLEHNRSYVAFLKKSATGDFYVPLFNSSACTKKNNGAIYVIYDNSIAQLYYTYMFLTYLLPFGILCSIFFIIRRRLTKK